MMEWKEYITVETLTLIVAVATFVVTVLALCYNRKSEKMNKRNLIASKEAQLKAMRDASRLSLNATDYGRYHVNESQLEAEIEQLKKQL